ERQIPLGTPLANTQVYVLDPYLNPVPIGVQGELHIAGAGVARGYLKQPELSAEKFIDNPFNPGTCLYKTGDLVRWLADGLIEFVGRRDHQVKIRGFRVELGEIETVLANYPGLQNPVVVTKTYQGNKQLIAFYTQAEHAVVEADALKAYLRQALPEYMLPVAFVALETLPLTASGKINRKALEQQPVSLSSERDYVAPQGTLETQLVVLWEALLGVERVGVQDNFFELGGHSLLTVQLVNQMNLVLDNTQLTLADVFKYPTIKELLNHLAIAPVNAVSSPYIVNLRSSIPTFIIPGMPGLSDGYFELADCLKNEGPVYGLQMQGYCADQPATTIQAMAAHNIAQIQTLQTHGKINLYAHSYGGTVVYEMLQQLQSTAIEVGEIVFIDSGLMLKQGVIDKASVTEFCNFILTNAGIDPATVKNSIAQILKNQPYEQWKAHLAELMQQTSATLDAKHFLKIWQVIETSITATYHYGAKLPYSMTLVIAEDSKRWLKANCWDAYFSNVRVIFAKGEHFSIVKKPDCLAWLQELSPAAHENSLVKFASLPVTALESGIILSARQLEKQYAGVKAVDGVSFEIKAGTCFGLLGPNGAGKTTTLEMMEGILKPSKGEIYFRAAPINKDYLKHIGIQFQHTALPELLTVKEALQLFQKLYKNSLPLAEIIEACALEEFLNRDSRKLSGGQRQRLLLGIALINDPDIIFLDEPTTGLDPQSRHNFWALIRNIKNRGKTIILTTHYMEEAEQLCDEIAIMDKGRILVQDTPEKLLQQHFDGVVIRLPKASGLSVQQGLPFEVYEVGELVEFITPDIQSAISELTQHQIPLEGLSIGTPNLENLFLKLTGHSLRS
ncbi:MAG: ATP-binding cassette domain-containing protein, partial [Methylococcales bacterium]